MSQFNQNFIIRLIDLYGLELDDHQVDPPSVAWLQQYDPSWIVKAIVESLYRGRYKIRSVDRILKDWQRLGKPLHGFTPDYERGILQSLPDPSELAATPIPLISSLPIVDGASLAQTHSIHQFSRTQSPIDDCENLNPEESTPFGRHFHSHPAPQGTHSVGDSESMALDRAYLPAAETIDPEGDDLAGSVPPEADAALQHHDDPDRVASDLPNRELPVDAPAHRINSQPVNHQLFATLKAIVDPHHQQDIGADESASLPLLVVNPDAHQIKQFKLLPEYLNEQQYL